MSRIGNQPITIPEKITVEISDDNQVVVKGPKGELKDKFDSKITITQKDDQITFKRADNLKPTKSLHGLTRSLVNNMIQGVSEGFEKKLELHGTGYRVKKQGSDLSMTLGFSHPVEVKAPDGIEFEVEERDRITVKGIDKQLVGQTAAQIRRLRPPEPYQGKGIRYHDEVVRRKPGKAAKVGAAGEGI